MTRTTLILFLAWGCGAWLAAEEPRVPLKTKYPQEILAGTPPDVLAMLFPGLAPPAAKAPKFLVPAGTKNLALHRKVTSSDPLPIVGKLSFVTDGNKQGTDGTIVELGPLKQWVQIDLGQPSTIYAVYVWHYFREARSYRDMVVQVADDPGFTKRVRTIYNNDVDNSLKLGVGRDRPYIDTHLGKLIDAKGVQARCVRLYSCGNTANDENHYVEVEIFGRPKS